MERHCPKCNSPFTFPSSRRGLLEDLCFVLGGEIRRCHSCDVRHAYLGALVLEAAKTQGDNRGMQIVTAAIVGGTIACLVIAVWLLRRFHRWPF